MCQIGAHIVRTEQLAVAEVTHHSVFVAEDVAFTVAQIDRIDRAYL